MVQTSLNIKKFILALFVGKFIVCTSALATDQEPKETKGKQNNTSAFIAKQGNTVIKTIGNVDVRHPPFSTFKPLLAYVGFADGILENRDSPRWNFKEEYEKNFQDWYTREKGLEYHWCQDHTPATFMKYSVLWFSHQITQRLGREKFQEYVSKLNYGNKDVSGTPGKNDGLVNSWLGTSLEISPCEQVEFLKKLFVNEPELSKRAQERTREVMDGEEEWGEWKLYGKTGGGAGRNGWFIGWIEKGDQRIIFAQYLDLSDSILDLTNVQVHKTVGLTAKEVAKKNLIEFWKSNSSLIYKHALKSSRN